MQPRFAINSSASARREKISSRQHCVVVDDFLQNPQDVIDSSALRAAEFARAKSFYPGQFIDVPDDSMIDIYRFIRQRMTRHFSFMRGKLKFSSFLSMVTLQPDELSPVQRICHVDPTIDADRTTYAALLYLFENEELGGTSFFRYTERYELLKEVETLERDDPEKARKLLLDNFPTFRKSARYMTESNEIAELLCTIPARFNRLVFYSGRIPHSAAITAPELLSTDIRSGRLTLNIFVDAVPK